MQLGFVPQVCLLQVELAGACADDPHLGRSPIISSVHDPILR